MSRVDNAVRRSVGDKARDEVCDEVWDEVWELDAIANRL